MKQKKVLIVDDSEFDRQLLGKAFARKDKFQTLEAASGVECLRCLDEQPVDLVLLDILMPGSVGTEVLTEIRKKFNPIELPIIMVTSRADVSDVIGCLKCGANDYITKPVNFEVATSRILTHLTLGDLSRKMTRLQEKSALNAMVTTYNHEINNPLAAVTNSLYLALMDRGLNQETRGFLEQAEQELARQKELFAQQNTSQKNLQAAEAQLALLRVTAPLRRLTEQAEQVDAENVAALKVEGTTEIRMLAEAFNRLIQRLTRHRFGRRSE